MSKPRVYKQAGYWYVKLGTPTFPCLNWKAAMAFALGWERMKVKLKQGL